WRRGIPLRLTKCDYMHIPYIASTWFSICTGPAPYDLLRRASASNCSSVNQSSNEQSVQNGGEPDSRFEQLLADDAKRRIVVVRFFTVNCDTDYAPWRLCLTFLRCHIHEPANNDYFRGRIVVNALLSNPEGLGRDLIGIGLHLKFIRPSTKC